MGVDVSYSYRVFPDAFVNGIHNQLPFKGQTAMKLREMRDKLDWLCRKYGDANVFIRNPDGEEILVPEDIWATLVGPVFHSVYIETKKKDE